ncbi:MAG TPA: MerR family transcriptional regulator [Pirellulaceae bacterium]|nr:MerR family transcriptional regulator [Pirellulaceae bacterium]
MEPAQAMTSRPLGGKRIALLGELRGLTRSELRRIVISAGGAVLEPDDPDIDLLVIGDEGLSDLRVHADRLADLAPEVIDADQFRQRLGLEAEEPGETATALYTAAMFAQLCGVSLPVVRAWHRRGLIRPSRVVQGLAYYDFRELASARVLAKLVQAGASVRAIQQQLGKLAPHAERPLADLSVLVDGKRLLLRSGNELVEPGGQLRMDFEALEGEPTPPRILDLSRHRLERLSRPDETRGTATADELTMVAAQLEEAGQLEGAIEAYRSYLVGYGATAEVCFFLAELLYRVGDLPAARERYYMAIELDEAYVEARANLGCVLVELGDLDLAAAAFRGALRFHPDYPDVHFHLARLLDRQSQRPQAEHHWRTFLSLAPQSPWADEARERLSLS